MNVDAVLFLCIEILKAVRLRRTAFYLFKLPVKKRNAFKPDEVADLADLLTGFNQELTGPVDAVFIQEGKK